MTISVGVRELTRRTSAYVRRAAEGEQILITDNGRPVAQLVPLTTGNPAADRLIAEGKLIPAANPGGIKAVLAMELEPLPDGVDSAAALDEERADRL